MVYGWWTCMALPILGLHRKGQTNKIPLLMERLNNRCDNEHVIDVRIINATSSSSLTNEDHPSTSSIDDQPSVFSAGESDSRNSSLNRRENSRGRQRSPLNSALWISVELVLTVSQIIAAIVVLSLSKYEKPHAPLRAWIVGYASGCFALLPLLCWRLKHRNPGSEQDSTQSNNSAALSTGTANRTTQSNGLPNSRIKVFVEYLKMALDCFFAVWFVVGNVWVFGGHSSSSESPSLYRLCIVFLTVSCIGYAMPFILCATICCCLPCIISVLGFREDFPQNRGATQDSINSLPTYKFKLQKHKNGKDKENSEGGVVAAGTERERTLSGEDAVCCICLTKYVHNDELRELPCSHFFHKECVDKWLNINATCPLCKAEVGETILDSLIETTASLRNNILVRP